MELLDLITLILSGKRVDKSLPGGKIVTFDLVEGNKEYTLGSFLEVKLKKRVLDKLLYLQTLSMEKRKVGGYPQFGEIVTSQCDMSQIICRDGVTQKDIMNWKDDAMEIELQKRSNLWDTILTIENLIVMTVELNVPSEVQHRGVKYRVNSEGQIRRVAISEPQFLRGVVIPT